jgi:hypothetical protein
MYVAVQICVVNVGDQVLVTIIERTNRFNRFVVSSCLIVVVTNTVSCIT